MYMSDKDSETTSQRQGSADCGYGKCMHSDESRKRDRV